MSTDGLILVKHAMPVIVPDSPPRTWRLSDAGREASARLAKELAALQPAAVVTSVEPKAAETGHLIAGRLHIPASTAAGLHEHERDTEPFDTTERFHERMRAFFDVPDTVAYGSESADQAHARYETAIRSVLAAHLSGVIVIVSHGTVMTLLVARANGLDPFSFWRGLGLPSYVVVERDSFALIGSG